MYYYYDPSYLLLIPGLLLALYAQFKVNSTYKRYSEVPSRARMTGAQMARAILDGNGCGDVDIECVRGSLTDHYDPENGVLRLSTEVYHSSSIAALGVAALYLPVLLLCGIVKKNGEAQNQPAGIAEADELSSITVEQKTGETIFEIKLPINTYRAEKMPAYYDHEAQLKLGEAKTFGELQQSTANDVSYGLMNGTRKIDDNYKSHNISFTAEEDRLGIKGDFAEDSSFEIILTKGFEKRSYKLRATKEAHAALCVSSFIDTSTESNKSINIERYINNTGLSGLYNIYLRLGDTIYDTGRSIKF